MHRLSPKGRNYAISNHKNLSSGFALLYIVVILALLVLLASGAATSLLVQRRVVLASEARKVAHYRSESAVVELRARLRDLQADPAMWKKLQRRLFSAEAVLCLDYFPDTKTQFGDGSTLENLVLRGRDGNRLTVSATSNCEGARCQIHSVGALAPFFAGLLVTTGDIFYGGSEVLLDPVAAGGTIAGLPANKKLEKAVFAPPYWHEPFPLQGIRCSAGEVLDVTHLDAPAVQISAGEILRLEGSVNRDLLLVVADGTRVEIGQLTSSNDNIFSVVADDVATTASQGYDGIVMLLIARQKLHLAHQGQATGTFLCMGDISAQIEVAQGARLVYMPPSLGWLKATGFITADKHVWVYSESKRTD
jgi:hypothetical protein